MALVQQPRRPRVPRGDQFQRLKREIKFLDEKESRAQLDRLLKRMRKDFRRFFPRKKTPFDGVK